MNFQLEELDKLPRKDIFITILVGIFTALVWISVFLRLGTFENILGFREAAWGLIFIVPIVYVFGLYLGEWLSRWWAFFKSFAKYVMVGFLNSGVDFAVFNLLMHATGIDKGPSVSSFKTVSFFVAVTNSYFWNKYWAFEAAGTKTDKGKEFVKFFVVNVIGAFLNVGITSGVIFAISPQFGFSQVAWNNIAAVIATAIALIWNFIGFRLIVFKKSQLILDGQPRQQ